MSEDYDRLKAQKDAILRKGDDARQFVDNIIAQTCNLGDVHPEVREDLYREVGALITAVSRNEIAKALFRADFKQWQHTLADDRCAVALLEAISQRFEQRFG